MNNNLNKINQSLSDTQIQKQKKEQERKHQEELKYNLITLINAKKMQGVKALHILENKHDLIIESIKMLNEKEQDSNFDEYTEGFENLKDLEDRINFSLCHKKHTKIEDDEQQKADYNYLDEIFYSLYLKIEREQKQIEKLEKQERQEQLKTIITKKINYELEKATQEQKNTTQKDYASYLTTTNFINFIIEFVKNNFDEYSKEEIEETTRKITKKISNDLKNTIEEEQEETKEDKNIRLALPWRILFGIKAFETIKKHL